MKNSTINTEKFTKAKIKIIRLITFTALIIYGLIFTACDNPTTKTNTTETKVNSHDLTGTITITAENDLAIGEELTAVYTGTETVSYQWNKDGNAIPSAVSKKYIPSVAGSYTVTVSAEGYNSKTSAAVTITDEILIPLTGTITITSENGLTTGAELTAVYTGKETINYQWNKDGTAIPAAVSSKYIPPIAGRYTVTVRASGYNSKTSAAVIITGDPLPALTGEVYIIYGTIDVGQTLYVDGYLNGNGTISYQWNRGGTPISGANGNTYTVQSADAGLTITVTVTRSGYSGSITSAPTTAVPPALTGTVSIIGTGLVKETLIADTSNLGGDGTISYQWKRGTTNIGINSNVYVVQSSDIGSIITVTVTRSGYSGVTSEPVGPVFDPSLPALTGTVSITGIAEIGQNLWANTNSLGGSGTIFYFWKRGTANMYTNNSTYFVPFSDTGSTITVTVYRSGNSGSITSEPVQITTGGALQSTPGLAFTLNNGGTAYSVSKGTATANEVVIPAFYNGLPVTVIPEQGFVGYTNMTSITIPSSVTSIGQSAFYGCGSLTSITIPFVNYHFGYIFGASNYSNQNSYIPSSLKTVVITGGTSIGQSAFSGCSGLTSITIPSSVTSIGERAFAGCSGLTSITIPFVGRSLNESDYTYTHFGYIFGASSNSNQNSSIPSSLKTVVITGGTSIGQSAFSGCSGLTSITITSSVQRIGNDAFYGCSGLTSITIPSSVTSIGLQAFSDCSGLTSITIPSSVTSIGLQAFSDCSGLTSITIPSSVQSIDQYAFYNCSGLTSVTFQGTITSGNFNSYAFNTVGDLRTKYLAGGEGTYTRPNTTSTTWTKE